jgi:hypothetical protein
MFYTVYKTTNLINGKIYIGCHKTENLNDDYLGSGAIIIKAIQKYGPENFKKEILYICEDSNAMFEMESELVNEHFVSDNTNYNIKLGGRGGFDYINSNNLNDCFRTARKALTLKYDSDPEFKKLQYDNAGLRMKQHHKDGKIRYDTFTGKKHTEETKLKIGKSNSKMVKDKNSQFGSMWITDGAVNKKIKKTDLIPDGWKKGRVM